MAYAQPKLVEMTAIECGKCGIQFHVPETWRADKQKTGNGWYCPNGHSLVYCESDNEKAKKALADEKERHANTLARLNEAQADAARVKRRIAAGMCPCCNRTFQQLARHMKTKHPDHK